MNLEAVSVLILFLSLSSSAGGQDDCEYMFLEEPLQTLSCNPYSGVRLVTVCSGRGPSSTQWHIEWFFQTLAGDTNRLVDNIDETPPTYGNGDVTRSSRLSIVGDDRQVGQFRCQIVLDQSDEVVGRSNPLLLLTEGAYADDNSCGDTRQSLEKTRCVLTSTVTDVNTTPMVETIALSLTTLPLNQTSPDESPENLGTALYAVVGVIIVFCAVIVTLTVVIVLLYRRKCARVEVKTADHRANNPYSGFTQRERTNGISKDRPSSLTSSTHSTRPHHHTTHSPASLINVSVSPQEPTEEPYSKLVHAPSPPYPQTALSIPGYSKLTVGEERPTLHAQGSKSNSPSPNSLLTSSSSHQQRVSRIYSDLDDQDLEEGVRGVPMASVPPISIYNTLDGPGRIQNVSNIRASHPDYDPVVPKQDCSKNATQKPLFDDPEYSPLKGAKDKPKFEVVDPRYIGDYERSPSYTCPTVTVKANEMDPKYRGDYERDPTYIPKPPPRRASFNSEQSRCVSNTSELVSRRQSLETEAMYKYRGDYERSPNYVPPPPLKTKEKDASMIDRKYSGNYERDPIYMANMAKKARQEKASSAEYSYPYSDTFLKEESLASPHQHAALEEGSASLKSSEYQQGTFMDI